MNLRCPFCRDAIEERAGAVQCVRCMTALHEACWGEANDTCTTRGCTSTQHAPLTRGATAKIVIGAGRRAVGQAFQHARERIGGKSVVGLLMLSILTYGLIAAPLLATKKVTLTTWLGVLLGGLFVIMTAWITSLLYRGEELQDDMELKVAETNLGEYYPDFVRNPGCGCPDGGGCSGIDGEGALVVLAIIGITIIAILVLPLVAWIAIELVVPVVVLTIYGTLYGALAMAVNGAERVKGRLLPCLARGILWGLAYTSIVAGVVYVGVLVKRTNGSAPARTTTDQRLEQSQDSLARRRASMMDRVVLSGGRP